MRFKIIQAGRSLQSLAGRKDPGNVMDAADASISDEEGNDAVEVGIELGRKMSPEDGAITCVDVGGQAKAYFIGTQRQARERMAALKDQDDDQAEEVR